MNELATILSQPITQIGGIIGVVILLQRAGVDVASVIRSWLNLRDADTAQKTSDITKNTLETMIFQMSELSNHFNHETTGQLDELRGDQKDIKLLLQQANEILRAIDKYGIKCRKD